MAESLRDKFRKEWLAYTKDGWPKAAHAPKCRTHSETATALKKELREGIVETITVRQSGHPAGYRDPKAILNFDGVDVVPDDGVPAGSFVSELPVGG